MAIILRFVLLVLIVLFIYSGIRYLLHPKRKLELAHEQKRFYFLDDVNNVRKNFVLTYKGVLFEGEKYLGTTRDSFEVVSIFIFPRTVSSLKGLTKNDFKAIEQQVLVHYPKAKIDWKSPIKEFLNNKANLPDHSW
ncbi:sigma-w pathway protein ysdB [Caldibacillus lycopersici]|uniref:Sigma-w pathway protein ysdB n=1 Tax=Perspicuibacillus lycopersici TaxID=1325689 RepID=A0AAE3ITF9_9BACI|nr:sigma-w pathway protein ysdB [Perspicuibacillus lycopersici]MCU9614161.1 sigma-w pathway protein ysdB [Perspicuibacillus lycopersici]